MNLLYQKIQLILLYSMENPFSEGNIKYGDIGLIIFSYPLPRPFENTHLVLQHCLYVTDIIYLLCMSVCLSVCDIIYLLCSVCSTTLSVCLSVCDIIYLLCGVCSTTLYVCLSVCMSVCLWHNILTMWCMFYIIVCLSVCLSVGLSVT